MKNKIYAKITKTLMMVALMLSIAGIAAAQDDMMKDDKMMTDKDKPTVAIIRADWCPACKQLEPTMMKLMESYKDRINFVILDITNDDTTAKSAITAKKNGLGKFFDENKKASSTVAVFDLKGKQLFKTKYDSKKETYTKAFDDAIAKSKESMMK